MIFHVRQYYRIGHPAKTMEKEKNEDTHEGDDPSVMHARTRQSLSHEEQVVNNTNGGRLLYS